MRNDANDWGEGHRDDQRCPITLCPPDECECVNCMSEEDR